MFLVKVLSLNKHLQDLKPYKFELALVSVKINLVSFFKGGVYMKNLLISIIVTVLMFSFSVNVFAQGQGNSVNQGQGDQQKVQDPSTHTDDAPVGSNQGQGSQNQGLPQNNQQKTQNQGEDYQIQIQEESGQPTSRSDNFPNNRSDVARQNMSNVAKEVEKLLADETITGGIGEQVSEIAKNQKQAQEQIENQYNKMKSRGRFLKTLIGPNREAVEETKQIMQQNQQRINELQELSVENLTPEQQENVQGLIDSLTSQNVALQQEVSLEEQVQGIFGWITKIF